jgi:subtilisin-like proprotein convertase family protein
MNPTSDAPRQQRSKTMNGDTRWRRLLLVGAALAPIVPLTFASTIHAQSPGSSRAAATEGTWCNEDRIAVPAAGSSGVGAPYPSTISVAGADNTTTQVTVELLGLAHTFPADVDVLLVAPTGRSLTLMSDHSGDGGTRVTGVDLTFSDDAGSRLPESEPLASGTYLPTNWDDGEPDTWMPPGSLDSGATELATFDGDDPNGTWSLYVADDSNGDVGWIGGWCLTIATDATDATITELTSTPNPSPPGESVTFTATVTSEGQPVTDGTVTFSEGGTPLATVDFSNGREAQFATNSFGAGRHLITATFDGAGELGSSSRSIVHNVATAADGMWCSNDPMAVPGAGTDGIAGRYPSAITVAGAGRTTTDVTVQLGDVNHESVTDLDVMLVSPTGRSLVLMSDTGGFDPAVGAGLTFSDGADGPIPEFDPLLSGTYVPTNVDDGDPDLWTPPAPPDSSTTELALFDADDPNGTWTLYVVDDDNDRSGWIGGWCLTIATADVADATTTALTANPNPSVPGGNVTFAATVTTGGQPVTDGTVTFSDGTAALAEVPVDEGRAVFRTDDLTAGRHLITARFGGAVGHAPSSRSIVQNVSNLAGGQWCSNRPITISEFGTAAPYPSAITVDGLGAFTTDVAVRLGDVSHPSSNDLEVMLVAPTGQNLVLMSDVRADDAIGADVTFSDRAAEPINTDGDLTTGTYRPTDRGGDDVWPAPAPAESGAVELAAFDGGNPNGTWRLFVHDDEAQRAGWIGSWCLDVSVDQRGPQARPAVSPAPNAAGWHRGDVTVSWNWSDRASGVDAAHCPDQTTTNRQGRRTLTAACRDRVGNRTVATRTVRVDTTAPIVTINAPSGRRYVQGTVVRADFTCRDGISGIASCRGTTADGAGIDTFTRGRHRFTVVAQDRAGNGRRTAVSYTVVAPPTCAGRRATIVGTSDADVLTGTSGPDVIAGGGRADTIIGGGAGDTICAGAGADTVYGGDGDDLLIGGGGDDALLGLAGNDHLDGGPGPDACHGGPGTDQARACKTVIGIP